MAVRHGRNACIVRDGLSDPWVERDKPEIGLGLEIFIEPPGAGLPVDASLKTLAGKPLSLEFNIDHINLKTAESPRKERNTRNKSVCYRIYRFTCSVLLFGVVTV